MSFISKNLAAVIKSLPLEPHPVTGQDYVPQFGVLVEMHRDNDGLGSPQFRHSFRRGDCAPEVVGFIPASLELINEGGDRIPVADDQKFLTMDQWRQFIMDWFLKNGRGPLNGDGLMPTRYLRDHRVSRNLFKSFRQVVIARAHAGSGTNP